MSEQEKTRNSNDSALKAITTEIATNALRDDKSRRDKPIPPKSYMIDRG
jgi:hypothetical protein